MQSHVAEVLIVRFIALLLLYSRCIAYQTGPLASTCERFHVSHGSGARNVNANVTILLRKMDGTEVSCIQTSENYRVELISPQKVIKGFMLQAGKGQFPTDKVADLPHGVRKGPCSKSLSHLEKLNTKNVSIGFRSSKNPKSVTFRYTVVFSMTEHMENRNVTFKQCPPPIRKCTVNATSTDESDDVCRTDNGTEEPTVPPECMTNITENNHDTEEREEASDTNETVERNCPKTNGICGKSVSLVNMTRPYVDPSGIRYRCTSKNLIKQVLCTPRCVMSNNKRRCDCKPQDVPPKRRKFICVACSEDAEPQSIEVSLEVNITSRCVCFECCENTNMV